MMKRSDFGEEASSPSRSPSSHMQTSWNLYSLFPRDSSSSSSYFSNGLCSSEDGSSHFAFHPFDRNLKMKHYNSSVVAAADEYNELGLCKSLHRLNIRDKDKTCHHSFGVSSDFSVDKASLVPNFQSYGESSFNIGYNIAEMTLITDRFMVSSPNKSMFELNNHHSAPSYSSPKGGNTNYPSLPKTSGIEGYVYLMAKDQHGCRSLQRILEDGTCLDSMIIFNEVIPHVVEVMTDPFGNYLMQKILDVCNEEQRMQIILIVTAQPGWLVQISLNTYGTRVVQRLVETVKTKKQVFLVKSALRLGFLSLVRDVNGNHVIQRCLQYLSKQDNEFIFEDATRFCIDTVTHQHGCCVLQKCIA
uniref:PUM-HD domain-containing protein n=1 Tax=Brassica oleracea var. oleracea TaxID=109376 RepID=A0A0D3D7F7_BRAOL